MPCWLCFGKVLVGKCLVSCSAVSKSRLCVDYHGLKSGCYPIPQIQNILESIHGATVFITLDLKSGYWEMELESESIQKTAFVTSASLFEFLRLSFGLKNAAASFQRLMENWCFPGTERKMLSCVYWWCNSVLRNTHLQHLNQVFSCLYNAGLTLNLKKCNFFSEIPNFLGPSHICKRSQDWSVQGVCSMWVSSVLQSLKDVQRLFF